MPGERRCQRVTTSARRLEFSPRFESLGDKERATGFLCASGRVAMATASRRPAATLLHVATVSLIALLAARPAASGTSGVVLNDYIRHFEPLFYDHHDVRQQHARTKRDADRELRVRFNAHNRLFKIRLKRSTSVFAEDAVLESTTGPVNFDVDKLYEGQLEDDDRSTVSAVVTSSGYLDATVSTESETYYVEPAERYFAGNVSFPAVIYRASDVVEPHDDHDDCPSHRLYLKQFEESLARRRPTNQSSVINECPQRTVVVEWPSDNQVIDRTLYSGWERGKARKQRRSTIDPRKTTCMLYLQADHLFYAKMGSEEACIESMTRHVQRVNSIYKNVDFDGDGLPDEINFMIKRIKVHTEQALNEASYRFPGNYGVEKFLELFSEEDYNAFCLAYMFTYRDFEGGTLGLAWTGDLKNAGGVCEKNGHYRGSLKSLNTGIVTLLNYGKHVPPAVSHVTLAHEIGHNFGSPHDPENNRDCTPGGEDGNYIMFARATSGDKRNNNKFSPCSLKSINGVLSAKARNDQGCFTEPQTAICGNGVVEAGEECDCGWEDDCHEKCCFPMRSVQAIGERPCTLRPSSRCSPSQGPCCTDECQLRYGVKCRDDNGCRDAAFCDGSGPRCPPSNNKPNKTVCNEEFVCFMGECTGSICIAYGLQSCQCLQGPGDPPTKACELCCKLPGDDQPCLSSFEWNAPPYDVPDAHAKAGTPCNNYNGYCDVFQRCREVDPSGPLATLRRLLLSDESIASLKRWVEDHWYGVLFIAAGFITVIVVIARVFGKRVQRKMRQRQRTSRTTPGLTTAAAAAAVSAALDDAQHIVHPAVVRENIPFKKKVREKESGKRSRAKHSSGQLAFAVFRKPMRSKRRKSSADRDRRRRSGVVNTKDKVRSWLERENPTHETVDSDNESHFPDEQANPRLNEQTASQEAPADAKSRKRSDLSAPRMMRSISETPQNRAPVQFSRSMSHGHEPDFRRLSRKTESHSHLLNSELELDDKQKEADQFVKAEPVTHPAVEKHIPIASGKIHKSATDGHLTKSGGVKSKFQSFEFLSLLSGRKADQRSRQEEASKSKKRIGIGPVKVVLKWHGASRTKPKRAANKAGKDDKRKPAKKKRVIVYKNGDPTSGATYVQAKEQPVVQQDAGAEKKPPTTNITSNPLDAMCEPKDATLKSRRYSMQERQAPPALMRHLSEVAPANENRRRNRHSWTVGNAVPHAKPPDVNIDIDADVC